MCHFVDRRSHLLIASLLVCGAIDTPGACDDAIFTRNEELVAVLPRSGLHFHSGDIFFLIHTLFFP